MQPLLTWMAEPPALHDPILVVALEGFVDAGMSAATAAMFLRHRWRGEVVARFDRDALLDFRARRPTAVVDSGVLRRLEWPDIDLVAATVDGPHDAAFLVGPEPDARWGEFAEAVAGAARRLGVASVLGLGAYPAAVPHTRPIRVMRAHTAGATDLPPADYPLIAGYTGPVGAGTSLQMALDERGIPAVGLWAEVPHYIAATPNPSAALALVRAAVGVLGVEVDTAELEAAANLHREQVDEAVSDHAEAAELIAVLEGLVDHEDDDAEGLPSGEELALEIERFLRGQGGPAGTGPGAAGPV